MLNKTYDSYLYSMKLYAMFKQSNLELQYHTMRCD